MKIITTELEVQIFLAQLQEHAAGSKLQQWKIKKLKLGESLQLWLKHKGPDIDAFFAVEHELPDHVKNDGYGCYKLFRYLAVQDADKKIHLVRNYIELFYY